nr:pyruvate, phosphate dikinase [Rhodococcus wratislaviensis]GLK41103.1 pyruvate, phosphate dikinase [Rhodococcus wratislaviensis]
MRYQELTESNGAPGGAAASDAVAVALDGISDLPRAVLGNKAFGINLMRGLGVAVPPAFCLTTRACAQYFADPHSYLDQVWPEVLALLASLEAQLDRTFGHGPRPLLVSVRSGAAQSMPGMLDTILNLGFTDEVQQALARASTAEFSADTRRRFEDMYRRIVVGDPGGEIPSDPLVQLRNAIESVFQSWHSDRAATYRRYHGLDGAEGTAVIVQAMVFGNMGTNSGTGVLFTRNPTTGAPEPLGEWLCGGQGEDVVSGSCDAADLADLRAEQPQVYTDLMTVATMLEQRAGDVQDIEYTVEEGRLWILQTRNAKRSAQAAIRLALQFVQEGRIDEAQVAQRVTPEHIKDLLRPTLLPETRRGASLLAKGLAASPGIASGRAYADIDEALDAADAGQAVILVRPTTSPDDVEGMIAAGGIVTDVGGATSHAAVVSREIGRPTVVGCGKGTAERLAGKIITVDGDHGEIREGQLPLVSWLESDHPELQELSDVLSRVSPLRAHPTGDFSTLSDISAESIRSVIAEGHRDVVCASPLRAMLTALRLDEHVPTHRPF